MQSNILGSLTTDELHEKSKRNGSYLPVDVWMEDTLQLGLGHGLCVVTATTLVSDSCYATDDFQVLFQF